jgi:hypothetical protein
MEEIYNSGLQRWSIEFVISFSKIWEWGLAYSFWDYVIQILLDSGIFSIFIPNCEK